MIPLADRRTFAELLQQARAQGWRIEMLSKQAVRVTHECHSLGIVVSAARPIILFDGVVVVDGSTAPISET